VALLVRVDGDSPRFHPSPEPELRWQGLVPEGHITADGDPWDLDPANRIFGRVDVPAGVPPEHVAFGILESDGVEARGLAVQD
jgi:hypothetical protein